MVCLAIGINLLPVFLTSVGVLFGGASGLTQEQLGRLASASFAGGFLGIVAAGPLADHWGAKPLVLAGLAVLALMLLALAWAPNYAALAFGLAGLGFGAGVLDVVLSPVMAALQPQRRTSAMNWLHAFYCVGAALTILAGTLVLRAGLGWRVACLSLVPAPAVLFVAFIPSAFPSMVREGGRQSVRQLGRDTWFWGVLIAIACAGATEAALVEWLPAYAEKSLGLSAQTGGLALLLFCVGMAIVRMLVGGSRRRFDSFQLLAAAGGSATVLFWGGAFFPTAWMALGSCVAAGLAVGCMWPTVLAVTGDRFPDGGGSMYGLLAAAGTSGAMVMPWIVGWTADRSSLRWGFAIASLAPLGLAMLVTALRRRAKG
jgi:fucose permease